MRAPSSKTSARPFLQSAPESPSTHLSKRPSALATAFHPISRCPLSPPAYDNDIPPDVLSQVAVHQQLHARASVCPTYLDKLLVLQGEIRHDNLCVCGVPDGASESAEELVAKLGTVLGALTSRLTPIWDRCHVGRFSPDWPRLVIVRFHSADVKVIVLRAKGVLYCLKCPKALYGIRVDHDLSVQ